MNIGLGLVARDTRLLFLDEPITGLDSFTANEVCAAAGGEHSGVR